MNTPIQNKPVMRNELSMAKYYKNGIQASSCMSCIAPCLNPTSPACIACLAKCIL